MASRRSSSQPIRLFQSKALEKLTVLPVGAFMVLWALVLPFVAWAGWGSASPLQALMLATAGWAAWFLLEYAMHRFVFHLEPRSAAARQFVFVMHGNHHEDPQDALRNLMPPVVSLPLAAVLWGASVLAMGPMGTWFFFGLISGYVVYDLIHYGCHQWKPRGRIGQALMKHHMRHHHADQGGNFAITGIFLDRWFGTGVKGLRRTDRTQEPA